eukprot:gene7310-5152_t
MINLNIGLMGHVDSGKTSLAKALSATASTAAFDKSPQSQERGITLDLGFSSRVVSHDNSRCAPYLERCAVDRLMCTFVDCPGHASLVRTIVGGAQIIDLVLLVIDATKGIQPQTAECLVIAEVLGKPLVAVLNKIDALQGSSPEEKNRSLLRMKKKLTAAFAKTRWPLVEMVEVAAAPGAGAGVEPVGIEDVLPAVLRSVGLTELRRRWEAEEEKASDFLMLADHCFAVRGHGTVFTGTVLRGKVEVGEVVQLPEHQLQKKVKSLQVFKKNVPRARAGDRVGLCVSQFDATSMERGWLCSAAGDQQPTCTSVLLAEVHRVRFHHLPCESTTKFHIAVGHTTVMGTMRFFSQSRVPNDRMEVMDLQREGRVEAELGEDAAMAFDSAADGRRDPDAQPGLPVPVRCGARRYFAVVLLEQPLFTYTGATFVAMRLDVEREGVCRIAVTGTVQHVYPRSAGGGGGGRPSEEAWRSLPVYRYKRRELGVQRVIDSRTCIAEGLVLRTSAPSRAEKDGSVMHAEAQRFIGMPVYFVPLGTEAEEKEVAGTFEEPISKERAVRGVIDSTFGKTGRVRLEFDRHVFVETAGRQPKKERQEEAEAPFLEPGKLIFELRKSPSHPPAHIHLGRRSKSTEHENDGRTRLALLPSVRMGGYNVQLYVMIGQRSARCICRLALFLFFIFCFTAFLADV